jgi:hypothetical protein
MSNRFMLLGIIAFSLWGARALAESKISYSCDCKQEDGSPGCFAFTIIEEGRDKLFVSVEKNFKGWRNAVIQVEGILPSEQGTVAKLALGPSLYQGAQTLDYDQIFIPLTYAKKIEIEYQVNKIPDTQSPISIRNWYQLSDRQICTCRAAKSPAR